MHIRISRSLLRFVFRMMFHILCDVRIVGSENIPSLGSYIIAINHISLFDPPFVVSFWPFSPEAIAAADVFERPWQKYFVQAYAAIPVHRGEYDRRVFNASLAALENGVSILIAPEGGRSHSVGMRRAKPGVAYIIERAGAPVLPVGVFGSTEDMLTRAMRFERPRLEMRIGKPFTLPPITGRGEARRSSRQHNADLVMHRIAELLPESYHGVYTGAVDPS